ncbi:MAG: hypothetical protein ACRETO_11215 [Gammaproteobacteria bacterium]
MNRPRRKPNSDSGFYEPYIQYARTLRAWFVAYGIGVPVLLVSQEFIAKAIIKAGTGELITWLFLIGVAVQVLAAFLYKYSMNYLYFDEFSDELEGTRRLKFAIWLSNAIWLEMLFDVVSIGLFSWGTFLVVAAALAPT